MKIELKNVKYMESMSEETNCFTATVYLDGVRSFDVSNNGHGGENEWHRAEHAKGSQEKLIQYAQSLPEYYCDILKRMDQRTADELIDQAFDEWMIMKEAKKFKNKPVVWLGNGKYISFKCKTDHPKLMETAQNKYPDGVYLWTKTVEEIAELIRSAN